MDTFEYTPDDAVYWICAECGAENAAGPDEVVFECVQCGALARVLAQL